MKKIYVLIAVAIIGIGWCTTVNATEDIIDLGTIEYSNTIEIPLTKNLNSTELINSTEMLILTHMYSEINKSVIRVIDPYLSYENKTVYTFVALHIEVEWWFKNDTKSFIYQDSVTGQLYRLNVDYAEIDIPPDPVIEWMNKYNESANSFDELQDVFKETLNELNETRDNLEARWLIYNQSKDEFDNKSLLAETLETELDELNIEYNETKRLWISATANASLYESYYNHLYGDHESLLQEHNDLSGIYPIYLIFAIIGTGFIVTLFFKRKKILGLEEQTDIEIDRDTGYSPNARRIDKFVAGLTNRIKPKNKGNPSSGSKHNPNNPLPESKPERGIEDIHQKVDELKLSHDAFQISTVKDIQGIQQRVDIIETSLELGGKK